ncbi:hypothetical protein [Arsukibacterium sp.]|uniref:hypothetical protein n=1 Tax=Arsukibacterium sp. TaxID=1977258 RepID=UPI002FD889FF
MSNLTIWKAVEQTAASATKLANLGGRPVTSINSIYMVKRATEIFGPVGDGWGYDIVEERFDQAAPIFITNEQTKVREMVCHEIMHTIKLRLWYKNEVGEKCEVFHFGHTPYIQTSKYGPYTDYDAPKKSLTDAIKKCLSLLGFSADVFMGMFDDAGYVEASRVKESIEKSEQQDEELAKQQQEFLAWCEREVSQYERVPNAAALRLVHAGHVKKLNQQCQLLGFNTDKFIKRFDEVYQARLAVLKPVQNMVCPECGTAQAGNAGDKCKECDGKIIPAEAGK